MIDKFLKAKHWQLFILITGVPLLFQVIMMSTMFSSIDFKTNSPSFDMFNIMKFIPIVMIISVGTFFGWFWSIAIGLQKKVPEGVTMKTKKFKIFFFIPLIYISLISIFISGMFSGISQNGLEPSGSFIGGMVGIILPLHLLSMFGIFYSMYFVAKTIKTVELQKEVSFSDFAGEFFMIWFYIIGIWIIQPKINKMIEDESNTNDTLYKM